MTRLVCINEITKVSTAYSYLGHRFLSGDVETAKYLYGNAWEESPPLIKTIAQLQLCLTAVEIEQDTTNRYSDEFLYYWGMICIGEVSRLIHKDLGTAIFCFKKIMKAIPQAEARLAYIELLLSDEVNKSENNVAGLEVLRKWASKNDFFSLVVLSKIIFYEFLQERQEDSFDLPLKAMQLLSLPCKRGHPVAIKFYNEMIEHLSDLNVTGAIGQYISESDTLYDL